MPREIIYSVFVSSTYEDLREERAEVQKALLKLRCMPIGMELFGSADEETWDFIKRQIEDCDYYLVVIADKYGSTAEDGVSYTEKEYDYARQMRKPILSFVHGDRGSIIRAKTEDDPIKRSKLEALIEKVRRFRQVDFFTSPHDLAAKVISSFVNERDRRPATGFIRADQAPDLKKYTDLLEENVRLRDEIAKTREFVTTPFSHASETAEIELRYFDITQSGKRTEHKYISSVSWQDLFISIAEQIITDKSWGEGVHNRIMYNYYAQKFGENYRCHPLDHSILDRILLQFVGWGLLESFSGRPRLTQYGRKQYGLLMP